jgi:uncharacterized protein YndB with AHSA1/START domain
MIVLALAAGLVLTGPAAAEVVARSDGGFRIARAVEIAAPPARVYAALGEVGRWWDGAHTYSGKAANMTLPLEAGACFCERLDGGGGVRHGVVALAMPSALLRLDSALGPLQGEGVSGALTFALKAKGEGSLLTLTYNVGGFTPAGVAQWAGPVDEVLTIQVDRFKRYLETGAP